MIIRIGKNYIRLGSRYRKISLVKVEYSRRLVMSFRCEVKSSREKVGERCEGREGMPKYIYYLGGRSD